MRTSRYRFRLWGASWLLLWRSPRSRCRPVCMTTRSRCPERPVRVWTGDHACGESRHAATGWGCAVSNSDLGERCERECRFQPSTLAADLDLTRLRGLRPAVQSNTGDRIRRPSRSHLHRPGHVDGSDGAVDGGTTVILWVTPVGQDYSNATSRRVTIRLVPSGTVIPPFGATAGFTITPATPTVFDQVRFSTACPPLSAVDCVSDPKGSSPNIAWISVTEPRRRGGM